MKISEILENGDGGDTKEIKRTYDLVYSSNAHRNIHARVWKELPDGLIKARLSKITRDRHGGFIDVNIVGTILDGERDVSRLIDGERTTVFVPKYRTETITKRITAKGVIPHLIRLRLVNVDDDYKYDHMKGAHPRLPSKDTDEEE